MNKEDLVREVAGLTQLSGSVVQSVVDSCTEAIASALEKKKRIMLIGFGTFSTGKRKARTVNHPQTWKPLRIEAETVPIFRSGTALKKRVVAKRGCGRPRKK